MDFEVENQGKSMQKRIRQVIFSNIDLPFLDFGPILEGFGAPNGGQDGPKLGKLGITKAI